MEYLEKTEQAVKDYFENLGEYELVGFYREFCQNCQRPDDEIFINDEEFFEVMFSNTMDAVRAVLYGGYGYADEFVKFNGYANLETTNYPLDWIDLDELAEDAMENPENYDIEFEEDEDLTEN